MMWKPPFVAAWRQRIKIIESLPRFDHRDVIRPDFDKFGIVTADDERTVRQNHEERFLSANKILLTRLVDGLIPDLRTALARTQKELAVLRSEMDNTPEYMEHPDTAPGDKANSDSVLDAA